MPVKELIPNQTPASHDPNYSILYYTILYFLPCQPHTVIPKCAKNTTVMTGTAGMVLTAPSSTNMTTVGSTIDKIGGKGIGNGAWSRDPYVANYIEAA